MLVVCGRRLAVMTPHDVLGVRFGSLDQSMRCCRPCPGLIGLLSGVLGLFRASTRLHQGAGPDQLERGVLREGHQHGWLE